MYISTYIYRKNATIYKNLNEILLLKNVHTNIIFTNNVVRYKGADPEVRHNNTEESVLIYSTCT